MKINVAVHIPLFNILSVRQAYCLSIGVQAGGGKSLSVQSPHSQFSLRHIWWPGQRSLSYGWGHPGLHFAYMLNKSQLRMDGGVRGRGARGVGRGGGSPSFHKFSFSSSGFSHVKTTRVSKQMKTIYLFGVWAATIKGPSWLTSIPGAKKRGTLKPELRWW